MDQLLTDFFVTELGGLIKYRLCGLTVLLPGEEESECVHLYVQGQMDQLVTDPICEGANNKQALWTDSAVSRRRGE